MGSWGTGISCSDTFMEVYEIFFRAYNHNFSIEEIKEGLERHFAFTIANDNACNDYWFAIAKALWECKELDNKTFEKVRTIIEQKQDLKVWEELGASKKDIKIREKVLDKFLRTISEERPLPKARKKVIRYSGIYEKGTCIAIRLSNGNYGGLLVLEQENNTIEGENTIVATNINLKQMPTTHDFLNAKILTGRHTDKEPNNEYQREYFWVFVMDAKRKRNNKAAIEAFINIGKIPIKTTFKKYFTTPFFHNDNWIKIIQIVEKSLMKIASGERENISATVEDWINNEASIQNLAKGGPTLSSFSDKVK